MMGDYHVRFCERFEVKALLPTQPIWNMNITVENRLKEISIRGRMALGIKCLEIVLDKNKLIHNKDIKELLSILWKFISSESLESWSEEIMDYDPKSLIEDYENSNFECFRLLSEVEIKSIYYIYRNSKSEVLELIELVTAIGTGNLYAGTSEYSKSTLIPTIKVLNLMARNNYRTPKLENFEKSKYSEFHGWGTKRDKSFFD